MISDRMLRAARLETGLYEEVEADTTLNQQALLVVVIAAIAAGIGSFAQNGFGGLIVGVLTTIVGWAVWSFLTYWIGTQFFGGTATYGELLRTIGFAYAPGVLQVFRFIPVLGPLIGFAASIWVLIAGVIAVRQALDVTTGKAVLTVVIGAIAIVIISVVLGLLFAAGSILT